MRSVPVLPVILTLAGVLPFLALTLAISLLPSAMGSTALMLIKIYSIVIITFFAGIHWGLAISSSRKAWTYPLLRWNLAIALLAWTIYLVPSPVYAIIALILLYAAQFMGDFFIGRETRLPYWFVTLRSVIAPLVILCLGVVQLQILSY